MHRREWLLVGAGAVAAKTLGSTLACAAEDAAPAKPAAPAADPHAGHAGHGAAAGDHAGHADMGKYEGFAAAARECAGAGDACLEHCLMLLADGDTSMAECAKRVRDMVAICHAVSPLAAGASRHVKTLAALCKAVCEDCAAECEKHADKHAACKRCLDQCRKGIEVAGQVAAG